MAIVSVGVASTVVAAIVVAMVVPLVVVVFVTVRVVRLWVFTEAALLAVLVLGARLVILFGAVRWAVGVVRQALLEARLLVRPAGLFADLVGALLMALLVLLIVFAVVARDGAALVLVQLRCSVRSVGVQVLDAVRDILIVVLSLLRADGAFVGLLAADGAPVWVVIVIFFISAG
jgi:hypothetical protein